jgi:hypothetical protein
VIHSPVSCGSWLVAELVAASGVALVPVTTVLCHCHPESTWFIDLHIDKVRV